MSKTHVAKRHFTNHNLQGDVKFQTEMKYKRVLKVKKRPPADFSVKNLHLLFCPLSRGGLFICFLKIKKR